MALIIYKEFARTGIKVGYYDHLEVKIIIVPFRELYFYESDHFDLQFLNEDGVTRTIPYIGLKNLVRIEN